MYVFEDGFGIKVGYTIGPVPKRIGELQTGNPRRITVVAEIGSATIELEELLHSKLNEWNITGEWFAWGPLVAQAPARRLRQLASQRWRVTTHGPSLSIRRTGDRQVPA